MNYIRSISGSVSSTWNSINPATLSGAIDVIVVEQEDGSLACSPFHIRFGKFSLLRPSEKKVEFKVNDKKQDYPMKLGEGGEAFFVFETKESIPEALQTSPLISPATSPDLKPDGTAAPSLQEPDVFDLESDKTSQDEFLAARSRRHARSTTEGMPISPLANKAQSEDGFGAIPAVDLPQRRGSTSLLSVAADIQGLPKLERTATDSDIPAAKAAINNVNAGPLLPDQPSPTSSTSPLQRSPSPPSQSKEEAVTRAINLSKKLWTSNIPTQVTDSGDLMLDMTGYKSDTSEAIQAEGIARKLLSEELEGPYDIGALIGADENGNLWIYSSEESKAAAARKAASHHLGSLPSAFQSTDAVSDPGYHSDDNQSVSSEHEIKHIRHDSDSAVGMASSPASPQAAAAGDPNRNYAKTLRLTSDQLKAMQLNLGANSMAFTVNRATCVATLWYWKHDVPIVISDIDGTITKSDVLGHVLNSIGRDWTHLGVAKLYTEIAANGYNFLYLTSRSVGQADTTRAYLDGVVQDGYKLPRGPVILSPDRTIAALRREIYLRKPEIFKMACLRDIMALFAGSGGVDDTHASVEAGLHTNTNAIQRASVTRGRGGSPFYAGFGNRLTDALSYRSVNIPSTRIFTINSNSEISLDLLSLNKYKTGYTSMREIVDHYFPPFGLRLLTKGGDDFTDFNYWRDKPLEIVDFTDSEDEDQDQVPAAGRARQVSKSPDASRLLSDDEEGGDDLMDSYLSERRSSISGTIDERTEDDDRSVLPEDEEDLEDADEDDIPTDELDELNIPSTPESGIQRRLDDLLGSTPRSYDRGLTGNWDS